MVSLTAFLSWKTEMKRAGHYGFCFDGKNSSRRIVFLLKEQNDNDGEDVREWSGSKINNVEK